MSLALCGAGYSVALAGRHMEPLEETASMASGGATAAIRADVGNPSDVRALFGDVQRRFGRLDVLFNNAGMGAPGIPMEDLTYEQWSAVVAA